MILFDPITGEKRETTYEKLVEITGRNTQSLRTVKCKRRIIKEIQCYIVDDDTTRAEYKILMETVKPKDEIWKLIKNSEKYYVSNYGRVKHNGKFLVPCFSNNKTEVHIKFKDGRFKIRTIQRLVAEAFYYIEKEKKTYHKDLNPWNNRAENIGVATRREITIKFNEIKAQCIIRVDPRTGEEREYRNARQASQENFLHDDSIRRAAKGRVPMAGNYIWKYAKGI